MTKRINVFLLVFVCYLPALASPRPANESPDSVSRIVPDTLTLQSRSFEINKLNEFKADPDYLYSRPRQGMTFWQRFLLWVAMLLARFAMFTANTILGRIIVWIFYGLCACLILYVILRLLNLDVRDLFYKSAKSSRINFKIAEEDIHGLDFDKLIQDAVQRHQLRDAVRLVFLFSLKKLSDAGLIQWMPGKTNDEYLHELDQHPTRARLQELRYYFDYAWYGHFEINDRTFEQVQQVFRQFNDRLS